MPMIIILLELQSSVWKFSKNCKTMSSKALTHLLFHVVNLTHLLFHVVYHAAKQFLAFFISYQGGFISEQL